MTTAADPQTLGAPQALWTPQPSLARGSSHALRLAVAFLAVLTLARVLTVFATPLELYPDEAQYWLWSRHLALGYFSKPPMIAWLIRATTAVGGQSEPWIRVSAPILHGLTAFFIALAGRRLYGPAVGAAAAAFYALAPGVDLSSVVIATDAPLMVWLSLALWAYAAWWTEPDPRQRLKAALLFGLTSGLACLAKYAALYFAAGVLAHAVGSRSARARWSAPAALGALVAFLAAASPTLIWNALHQFQTIVHTAADADLGGTRTLHWFDPRGGLGFILGQCGVFGPIPFIALCIGAGRLTLRRRLEPTDQMLLAFILPPMGIVFIEAIVARANANWAGAAYGPAAILAAALLIRGSARRTLAWAIGAQAAMAAMFMVVMAAPVIADRVSFANSFKRARGWVATTKAVESVARDAGPLTAVAVDDRFLFNALAYYGRDATNRPAGRLPAPLKMWVRDAGPHNQAEAIAPLTASRGARVLVVSAMPSYRAEIMADFSKLRPGGWNAAIVLDPRHTRRIVLFLAEDFKKRPRDPRTGQPRPPGP